MPARSVRTLSAIVAVAAVTGGCGLANRHHSATTTTSTTSTTAPPRTTPADQRDPAPERGGTIPSGARAAQNKLAAAAGSATPQAALERYAASYLNWNATNVVQIQRRLAATSLGQARAQALQAAKSAANDTQLAGTHVANRGQVIAISRGEHAAAGHWVIVTSERTTGDGDYQGLPSTVHIIYALLTDTGRGWVVSGWQPQN